ncbi:MAG: AAA family ATPase [Gammaproteobacteria bacterium]
MKARREPAKSKVSSTSRPHVRPRRGIAAADLWVLRIMAQFSPRLLKNLDLDCEPLQRLLRYRNGEGDALSASQLGKRVKTLLEDAEQRPVRRTTTVDRRLRKISELLALDAVERDVLAFFVAAELGSLKIVVGHVAQLAVVQLTEVLGKTLKVPKNRIGAALQRGGTLRASGLVDLDGDDRLFRRVDLAPALGETIYSSHGSITEVFSSFFAPAPAAARTLGDFAYLKADLTLISRTLDVAMNERREGANVLLYGPPGTGKTELVRVLARHLRAELYEVSHQDADNDSLSGWQRFRHYMLCQRILSRKPHALILFDEIEDVIPHHLSLLFSGEKEHGKRKAWINKLLETNRTPAVWVSNRVNYIDPAILRRFDHLLEIPVPPLRARERIVRKYGARLGITADAASPIARNEKLTPADVERASKVVARADFDADSAPDSS